MHQKPGLSFSTQIPTGLACLSHWDNGQWNNLASDSAAFTLTSAFSPFISPPFCHPELKVSPAPVRGSSQSPHLLLFTGILELGTGNSTLGFLPLQHTIPKTNTHQEASVINLPSSLPIHISHSGPDTSTQRDTQTLTQDLTGFLTTEDIIPSTQRKPHHLQSHTLWSQRGLYTNTHGDRRTPHIHPQSYSLTHNMAHCALIFALLMRAHSAT